MADIEMTPITRKEFYLAGITGMDVQAPSPVTRLESYLNDILNGTVSQLVPLNRVECYLAKISGADVTIPVPVTRLEFYLAAIAGMDIDVPDPVTREEHWLWQWANAGPGGLVETVTGTLPLTLANALSHAIVSLTRYGLCTQADTPTPSAPVDIKCNNGVLTMVDDELPAGYKRLLGITFDGNFRYETGEALTGADDVTLTIDNVASSGKNLFGSYNGSNDKNFSLYIYGNASTGSYFRYGDQLKRPKYGTGRRTITFGASGTSGFAEDSTVTPDEFTTPANTYIGMLPNSSSPAFSGDIIGSILVGTRLEWIPCENPNGVIGYYEKYKGAFLAPVGEGTPVSLGYDYTQAHLAVVGTPEVLTVSASGAADQTATVESLLSVGTVADEQNIISGEVIRRCAVCCYNGTQTIGDVYISTTGGKDVGAIIVYPLATETTEQTTAQHLNTVEGTNIVDSTANVSPLTAEVKYMAASAQ